VHGFTLAGASRALHTNAVQQRTAPQHSITSASGCGGFGAAANCRNKRFGTKVPFSSWFVAQGLGTQGGVMTTLQAMCFGAMLAWTPSLVVLALLLRETPLDEFQDDPS